MTNALGQTVNFTFDGNGNMTGLRGPTFSWSASPDESVGRGTGSESFTQGDITTQITKRATVGGNGQVSNESLQIRRGGAIYSVEEDFKTDPGHYNTGSGMTLSTPTTNGVDIKDRDNKYVRQVQPVPSEE